jgi:hypothetical protein
VIALVRSAAPPSSKERLRLEAEMESRMPTRTVLEALKNAYHSCQWTRHFGPSSGSDPKLSDPVTRYILLAFSSGCNLGPWQTARHLRDVVTAHEFSYTNQQHVTAQLIDRGMRDIVNVYAQCALPKLWGTGKTAAADSTKLETATTNNVESYNAFSLWLTFGNGGKILDNDPIEMEKIVKFTQLVANCVMLQNVLNMSAILRDLIRAGFPVTLEAVQGLSPYLHAHIRRFGIYDVDLNEIPPPITEEMLTPLFALEMAPEPVPAG